MSVADLMMETFAMESVLLRTRKLAAAGKGANAADLCAVFLRDAMARIELSARNVLSGCSEGDALRTNMAVLRRLAKYEPVNAVALRRQIAGRLLARDRYVI
jgi:hypothetical protein